MQQKGNSGGKKTRVILIQSIQTNRGPAGEETRIFYCPDRNGTVHYGATMVEAIREAQEENREVGRL